MEVVVKMTVRMATHRSMPWMTPRRWHASAASTGLAHLMVNSEVPRKACVYINTHTMLQHISTHTTTSYTYTRTSDVHTA